MLIGYKRSQTSIVLRIKILDSTVTTGAGKTGLSSSSSGLIISTIADNESAATAYTQAGSTIETITTLGTYAAPTATKCRFKEVDATNHKGVYEIQLADARFAVASAKSLLVSIAGATGAADCDVVVPLRDLDPYDSVRAGLTSLPNAAAEASGGLPTLSAAQASNGTIQANVHRWLTGTPNALQSGRVDSYIGAVASGAIAAASFAANALDAVWSTATRVLTAGTNIVLAKGTGVTGFNDLSAAQVNTEADTALADAGVTTTRTGYLDNLSGGAVALASSLATLAGKFTGITLLAEWLGLIAGKQTGNSTARTELRATGAGSGTYDETTDSQEATRDNMGTAQTGDAYARLGAPVGASISADIAGVQSDTDNIQTRIPAALVSGRMDSSVGAMASGVLTATAIAADAITDAKVASDVTIASVTGAVGSVTGAVGSVTGNVGGNVVGSIGSLATQAKADVNAEADTALADVGVTTTVTGRIDAAISTRLASAGYTAPPTAAAVADQVWEETLADHSGTTGSTAEALNAAGAAGDPWATALPGSYGAGSAGKIIGDNINATVGSRAPESGGNVAAIKAKTDSLTFTTAGKVDARTFTNDDKTGYALTSAYDPAKTAAQAGDAMALTSGERTTLTAAIWAALTSGLTTAGSIGKRIVDYLTGDVFARVGAPAGASLAADVAAVKGDTAAALTAIDAVPTNAELATALAAADDAVLAAIALLNNLSSAGAQSAAAAALTAYGAALQTTALAVKAQTDKLTFTSGNDLDVNVQQINDTELLGDGAATPWGPV